MPTHCLTLSVPGHDPATLTLPSSLTPDAVARLEGDLCASLDELRRELEQTRVEAGALEYASWLAACN